MFIKFSVDFSPFEWMNDDAHINEEFVTVSYCLITLSQDQGYQIGLSWDAGYNVTQRSYRSLWNKSSIGYIRGYFGFQGFSRQASL